MSSKGNEVSQTLWQIDLFKEKVYFPLMSSKAFIAQENTPAGEVSLKNSGMTKATVPHAQNPIVLGDFDDVWAKHVNKMATYHSFVIPIDTLNKVFNYTDYYDAEESESIKTLLDANFGSGAQKYISQLLTDINGGVTSRDVKSPISGLIGTFKKTAVAASASVVVQ